MSGFSDNISNTSGPGSSAEPSMEEILASIRRILKEDEHNAPAPVDIEDDDVLVLDESMVRRATDLDSATVLPPEAELAAAHPDAPETSYHNEMHISSEPAPMTAELLDGEVTASAEEEALFDSSSVEAPAAAPAAKFAAEEAAEPETAGADFAPVDTTLVEAADAESAATESAGADSVPAAESLPAAPEIYQAESYKAEIYNAPDAAPPEPDMSQNVQPPPGLTGEDAASAAKSSIGALVRSINNGRAVAVSRGGITIEDIVREEIRPMLKAWLDTHLPGLVERIVQAEIERVVDRSQL
jgi:cell pole-organizing protein PopZ